MSDKVIKLSDLIYTKCKERNIRMSIASSMAVARMALDELAASQPTWTGDLPTKHGDYWERRKITVGQAVTPEGEVQGDTVSDEEGEVNWPEHHFTANRQWCPIHPPGGET